MKEAKRPEVGWGELFGSYLKEGWHIENRALNGRSTKSFIDEGHFQAVLNEAGKGDAAIIQFGHNDNKDDPKRGTAPFGSYSDNLIYMAEALESLGVSVYFATSISRRHFDSEGTIIYTHGSYPSAMIYAGYKAGVPVVDMSTRTLIELQKMGDEESKKLFMCFSAGEYEECPEGKMDNTHLRKVGAQWICELLYQELGKLNPRPEFIR